MTIPNAGLSRRGLLASIAGGLMTSGRAAAGAPVLLRRNVKDFSEPEWRTLEQGVAVMKGVARESPISWRFQANIHGYPYYEPTPHLPGWSTCQHGNWWFLPWHRAYLLYFEKILRACSGDPCFMLPYWDWTDPDQLSLPERFLDPASPLFEPNRAPQVNAGSPICEKAVCWPKAAVETVFSTNIEGRGFGGQRTSAPGISRSHGAMEHLCHDKVHDEIGGLMGDPATAARDPIFWLHHANVDRLWGAWLRAGNGVHLPREPLWHETMFLFYGPRGRGGYVCALDVLNSGDLGYFYDDYPATPTAPVASMPAFLPQEGGRPAAPPNHQTRGVLIASKRPPRNELTSEPLSVTFTPDVEGRRRVEEAAGLRMQAPGPQGLGAPQPAPRLRVVVEDVRFEESPGRFYEVYLNLPRPEDATGPGSPYYAGAISFFALTARHGGQGHAMVGAGAPKEVVIDATEAAVRLKAAGELGGQDLKVTLIECAAKPRVGATPRVAPRPRVTIGAIRLEHSSGD